VGLALETKQKILLDSVILIYYFDRHPIHESQVGELLGELETKACAVTLSSLVLAEILVPYYREKSYKKIKGIKRALSNAPNIHMQEMNSAIAEKAAELRASLGMKTPDAIHLATALHAEVDCLITNDSDFLKYQESDLEIVLLDQLD